MLYTQIPPNPEESGAAARNPEISLIRVIYCDPSDPEIAETTGTGGRRPIARVTVMIL